MTAQQTIADQARMQVAGFGLRLARSAADDPEQFTVSHYFHRDLAARHWSLSSLSSGSGKAAEPRLVQAGAFGHQPEPGLTCECHEMPKQDISR
jgi:hypothetical protein